MKLKRDDWEQVKLGSLGNIITGNTPKTSDGWNYSSPDVCFYKPSDISENRVCYLNSSENYISENASAKARMLPAGSVLVTCIGIIGKIAILENGGTCNQQINAIIPTKDKCNNKYLSHCIYYNKPLLQGMANAAVVPIINKKQFSEVSIPLPPLEAQKQIAAILDKASQLIELRKQQLTKMDLLIKSKFIAMFGDPVINPMGWDILSLGQLGELNRGVSKHRPRNAPQLLGGKYPLIQTGEVANADLYIRGYSNTYSELGLKQSRIWVAGTLCITIAANIAKTAILGFDACFPDSVVGFSPNTKTNQYFMHFWFGFFQEILEKQAPESAQKNINLKILNELKVIVPPIELQNEFAEFVDKVEQQKVVMQASLEKLEMNYKSLMQQYFG